MCKVGSTSNGVSAVITEMDEYVSRMDVKPSFVAVAGDNYYPKIEEATGTTPKKKYFNESELKSGFACLRDFQQKHKIPIQVIGGNHDTENTLDFEITASAASSRRTNTGSATSLRQRRESVAYKKNECLITRTEINMAKSTLMSFTMFNCHLFGAGNHTLVLMLDSNIYIENMAKLKDCYLPLLRNTVRHLKTSRMYPAQLNVMAFAETIQDAVADFERAASVETLRSVQLAWVNHILEATTRIGTINNVVIVAHHPLAYHKIKKNKMLFQTGADNDGGAEYLKLCRHIYGHFISVQAQFFYSCADLHTYQAGTVVLAATDGASPPIRINQQIAGTGGTTLETEYATLQGQTQGHGGASTTVDGVSITYDMSVAIHSHGFLHWRESVKSENGHGGVSSLSVEFIPIRVRMSTEGSGGTRRRRQRHRRKDNRKQTTRNRKMNRNRKMK